MSRKKSAAPSVRLLRVSENIRHALSAILMRGDIADPTLDGVSITVTSVSTSPDLRNATVFVYPLGEHDAKPVVDALNDNAAYIRGQLSRSVVLKYMPTLKFRVDTSFDTAGQIEDILSSPRVQRDLGTPEDDA